jgi:hypothetical protein
VVTKLQKLTTHNSPTADRLRINAILSALMSTDPVSAADGLNLDQMFCMIGASHRGTQESRDVARKSILYSYLNHKPSFGIAGSLCVPDVLKVQSARPTLQDEMRRLTQFPRSVMWPLGLIKAFIWLTPCMFCMTPKGEYRLIQSFESNQAAILWCRSQTAGH